MASPFPGMDPYIEGELWRGFHTQFMAQLQRELSPLVHPRYTPFIEEHVYLQREPEQGAGIIRPDVLVVESALRLPGAGRASGAVLEAPVTLALPWEETERQVYLQVRRAGSGAVVCVIELLSPTNKQRGTGRSEYLSKRTAVLQSTAHLIELDFLRDGARLPTVDPLPPASYYAFVSRSDERPFCGVWPISLREPLPVIPVPLADGDPDIALDLQRVFTSVYDEAHFGSMLSRYESVEPPLAPEDAAWAAELAAAR